MVVPPPRREDNDDDEEGGVDGGGRGDLKDDEAAAGAGLCAPGGYVLGRVVPCVGQLAVAAGNDAVWKALNLAVLMLTRDAAPKVRFAALKALRECFVMVGEEYLVMLPESLSFLSELLEDSDAVVEAETRSILKFAEEISGEELETYL